MHPATMQAISAERARELREQAAARRRAREARGAAASRPGRSVLARILRPGRPAGGSERLHGPASA